MIDDGWSTRYICSQLKLTFDCSQPRAVTNFVLVEGLSCGLREGLAYGGNWRISRTSVVGNERTMMAA
jgi:hypothetical protein